MTGDPIIRCRGVEKRFRTVEALRGVDLEIASGTLVAILGPNGAGKTTLVRLLTTLSRPTAGTVELFGLDTRTHGLEIRRRIGVVPQENNLDRLLTARENLIIQAQLHGMSPEVYGPRIERFLEEATLAHRAEEMPDTFSGGMQRRLVIARALLHDPPLIFLDEPTTGLDPQSRRFVWELVGRMKGGHTILLTTHYMEEAERLADRVVIVDEGRILIDGTPAEIKRRVFPDTERRTRVVVEEPTLEDVFLQLTGKAIREEA